MQNARKRLARKTLEPSLSKVRSAVSNGSSLLAGLDHRSAWARRLRDLIGDHLADLGGPGAVTQAEKALVRRAAMLTLQLELLEQRFASNEGGAAHSEQLETYQRSTNSLRRTLESLGLERRAKDVTLGNFTMVDRVIDGAARQRTSP
jgi:hypothetical protein